MRRRVEIVVVEKNKRGGGEDGRFEVVVMKFLRYEVVTGMITGMIVGDVAVERSSAPSQGGWPA